MLEGAQKSGPHQQSLHTARAQELQQGQLTGWQQHDRSQTFIKVDILSQFGIRMRLIKNYLKVTSICVGHRTQFDGTTPCYALLCRFAYQVILVQMMMEALHPALPSSPGLQSRWWWYHDSGTTPCHALLSRFAQQVMLAHMSAVRKYEMPDI